MSDVPVEVDRRDVTNIRRDADVPCSIWKSAWIEYHRRAREAA